MADDSTDPGNSETDLPTTLSRLVNDNVRMLALLDLIVTRGEETRGELIEMIAGTRIELTEKIDGLTAELRHSVDRLDGRAGRIETRVESIETQVKSLDTQVKSLDVKIELMDTRHHIRELDATLENHSARLAKIESERRSEN